MRAEKYNIKNMKNYLLVLLLLLSCNSSDQVKKALSSFKVIDYTYDSGWKDAFSIRIGYDGKCVIGDGRWNMKYYTTQLSLENIQRIDSMVQNIPFEQYDSFYREDVVDQASYKLVLIGVNRDTTIKFVYGRTAPGPLNDFSNYLRLLKDKSNLIEKDTSIGFISRRNFFPQAIKFP